MGDEKKTQQPAMTIEDQVNNLKSLGLQIEDEKYATRILNDISYFRLIKAYSLTMKRRNEAYKESSSFKKIVNLYFFNANFRHLLFAQIECIEVNLRCRISNYFSVKYGVLGYKDENNFRNADFHSRFLIEIAEEIKRNHNSPFVKNFQENYENGALPFYALVELFSFGTLSKFYKNMLNEDKKAIANSFGINYRYFESWIESIAYVRNICAHYGRLYNVRLVKKPILYSSDMKKGIKNEKIFGLLFCMRYLMKDSDRWNSFIKKIDNLVKEYQIKDLSNMGFLTNWKDILEK